MAKNLPASAKDTLSYILSFDNVTLADGKNTLKAVAMKNGKEYVDEIEWNYNGERDRSPEHYLNEKEHVGL